MALTIALASCTEARSSWRCCEMRPLTMPCAAATPADWKLFAIDVPSPPPAAAI